MCVCEELDEEQPEGACGLGLAHRWWGTGRTSQGQLLWPVIGSVGVGIVLQG